MTRVASLCVMLMVVVAAAPEGRAATPAGQATWGVHTTLGK